MRLSLGIEKSKYHEGNTIIPCFVLLFLQSVLDIFFWACKTMELWLQAPWVESAGGQLRADEWMVMKMSASWEKNEKVRDNNPDRNRTSRILELLDENK
jgi:hypothetical protein